MMEGKTVRKSVRPDGLLNGTLSGRSAFRKILSKSTLPDSARLLEP
jgi:hypothetical protein